MCSPFLSMQLEEGLYTSVDHQSVKFNTVFEGAVPTRMAALETALAETGSISLACKHPSSALP